MAKRKVHMPPKDPQPQKVSDHDAQVVIETEYLADLIRNKFDLYRESGMFLNHPDPNGRSFYLAISTAIVAFTYMKLDQYHELQGKKINVN